MIYVEKMEEFKPKCLYDLGYGLYVFEGRFQGQTYMHIRECGEDKDGKKYPTKKGITLNLQRWMELKCILPDIDQEVKKYQSGEPHVYSQRHLGGNWMVTVKSGLPWVDIRQYWLPLDYEEVVPTKKGYCVSFEQFKELRQAMIVASELVPEIDDTVPCYMEDDHNNQQGGLACLECNPSGYKNFMY